MKPVVAARENLPVNADLRREHGQQQNRQHAEFHRVAKFFQRLIQPERQQQQKRNQRTQHQPAGHEKWPRLRRVKTILKIKLHREQREEGEQRREAGEAKPERDAGSVGQRRPVFQQRDQGAGQQRERQQNISQIHGGQRERLAVPQKFALPQGREIFADEIPESVRRENGMMKPIGQRLGRPVEELDFLRRAGEIAEVDFAPRHPSGCGQAGAHGQNSQRRNCRAQFFRSRQLKNFSGEKNPGDTEQRQITHFAEKSRGQREARGGGEPGGNFFRVPDFYKQPKRRAKGERRKDVVVDGIKRRLRHQRDQCRHGEANEFIFRKNCFGGEPAKPGEGGDERDIQEAQPVKQAAAVQPHQFPEPPPGTGEGIIQRRLRHFMIFDFRAPAFFHRAQIFGAGGHRLRPCRSRHRIGRVPHIFGCAVNGDERQ